MTKQEKLLNKRHQAEMRFMFYGRFAIFVAFVILSILLVSLAIPGIKGMQRTEVALNIILDDSVVTAQDVRSNAGRLYREALYRPFAKELKTRQEKSDLRKLVSKFSSVIVSKQWTSFMDMNIREKKIWVPASDMVDMYIKGNISYDTPESERVISDQQIGWLTRLQRTSNVRKTFNMDFFSRGDSSAPERAGFLGAIMGSLLTIFVCFVVSFPTGVAAAIYLEEFSKKGKIRDFIEVNINNLAAVPSIVYGLLGLAVYINFFGMPRSAPLVGGLTLALMTLPTIIITTRVSLQSVPNSIRQAAQGLGASPLQVVMHHVVPIAMPGIMTGTILGLARAIGETAPLLMIGMVAFIVDVPKSVFDASTVMPVQIYIWSSNPEMGFLEKTSAGILVLIAVLLLMNALAIFIRKKYEHKW